MTLQLIYPDWQGAPANVGALSTTRVGGLSRGAYGDGAAGGGLNLGTHVGDDPDAVRDNRARLRRQLPAEPVWLSQVHGTRVVDAAPVAGVPDADASIASMPGVVCVVQSADCLPVLFCDVAGKVIGAAHAGWRGLAAGVLENTVAAMRAAGASRIMAWLGPAIGARHFEVGAEVVDVFVGSDPVAEGCFKTGAGSGSKFLADIDGLARLALQRVGIAEIYGGGYCTVSDPGRFYSFRRDKITGRMATCIWLK